ncbi:hypothetical protein D915_007383, partial [Fasciola hepatica]
TQLITSPTGRRIIKASVASLTGSHGSPLHGNSTLINSRRSASACSLPPLGSSPNDDLNEFPLHSNANGNAFLFSSSSTRGSWQPSRDAVSFLNNHQKQQNNTSRKANRLTEYVTTTGRSLVNGSVCAFPFLGDKFNVSSVSSFVTNNTIQALSASGSKVSSSTNTTTTTANSTGATTSLLSPTGKFFSQHQTGSHHQHHLRGLSFPPLAVDADLRGSLSSGINSTTAHSSDCFQRTLVYNLANDQTIVRSVKYHNSCHLQIKG